MTRLVGLDHGSRRIGVAVADTDIGMAFARPAIMHPRRGRRAVLEAIGAILAEERAELAIIGLPLNADGSEGKQASAARRFADEVAGLGVPVALEDERLTSWAAREELRTAGRRADRRSGELDSTAARLILQQYLDARRSPGGPEETA